MNRIIVTGLDFSEFALSAATVEFRRQKSTILALQRFNFNRDIFADSDALNHQNIVNKLIRVKKNQPLFRHKVAFAIPESAVMTKVVKTDKRLPFEQQHLSALHQFANSSQFSLQQLALDYRPCDQGMVVYAAKKAAIEQRSHWVRQAGMKTVLVDSEKQAFLRLLVSAKETSPNTNYLLIEITQQSLTLGFITETEQFYRHFRFNQQELASGDYMVAIRSRLTQELERIRALHSFSQSDGIWLINHLDHHDPFTTIADLTKVSVHNYPFKSVFSVKRSWQPQSFSCCAKACAIALRGIDALRHHYAA